MLGFLIAGAGLVITFFNGSLGLGVVIIGCTIVLIPPTAAMPTKRERTPK